jgi:hypothetical protein
MPYVFDFEKPGNEDVDVAEPNLSHFEYLPPPKMGGPQAPIRFSTDFPATVPRASALSRVFGRQAAAAEPDVFSNYMRENVLPALQSLGMKRAYCRYDGGNDEGFTWLDHIETQTGERISLAALMENMSTASMFAALLADFEAGKPPGIETPDFITGEYLLRETLRDELASFAAVHLLGRGYGTGPFYMYGAFTIDFETLTITDDLNAAPVVENITIAT